MDHIVIVVAVDVVNNVARFKPKVFFHRCPCDPLPVPMLYVLPPLPSIKEGIVAFNGAEQVFPLPYLTLGAHHGSTASHAGNL